MSVGSQVRAIVTLRYGGQVAVTVIGETPKRYRVRIEETAHGWRKGQEWLAPKDAVTFDDI